jgi:hypothetical protein
MMMISIVDGIINIVILSEWQKDFVIENEWPIRYCH